MNDKKKPLTHPELKKKRKELEGFEDVIDMIPGNRFNPDRKKINPKLNEDFELLNLLENEHQRLSKLDLFFNEKISNQQNFEQADELLKTQESNIQDMRERIIKQSLDKNSYPYQNIEKLMLTCFRKANYNSTQD